MRKNQQGFSAVHIIIILLAAAFVGLVGWYVWHVQSHDKKPATTPSVSKISSYAACAKANGVIQESYPEVCVSKDGQHFTNPDQKAQAAPATKYLVIKEWGVKLPLSDDDSGAYYTYQPEDGRSLGEGILVFDKGLDAFKNTKGVACKDPQYPLLAITRIKPADVAATQDINSPYYIGDAGPNDFKYFSFTKDYEFAAESSHQAAPRCEDIGDPAGDFQDDATVGAEYQKVRTALSDSYDKMQAE